MVTRMCALITCLRVGKVNVCNDNFTSTRIAQQQPGYSTINSSGQHVVFTVNKSKRIIYKVRTEE